MKKTIEDFVRESNTIERIHRDPTKEEIEELRRFMDLPRITIDELLTFVSVYQPNAKLRDQYNMDVRVGRYVPPFGGPEIPVQLKVLLDSDRDAYDLHIAYEKLHPFTDCNGRTGRALWAHRMEDISLGFLHRFYYQVLERN